MRKSSKISPLPDHCNRHQFSLRPYHENKSHPQNFNYSFCQEGREKAKSQKSDFPCNFCLNCPTFNDDRSSSTPTFVLRLQRKQYMSEKTTIRYEHENHLICQQESKSQLNVPKPRAKSNYCSVCRCTYDDYRSHIAKKTHTEKIRASTFNRHILALTEKYNKMRSKANSFQKIINVEKVIDTTKIDDSDQVKIIENPLKKMQHTEETCRTPVYRGRDKPCNSWHEQLSIDYAKQFVATFRGFPYDQTNLTNYMTSYMNLHYMAPFTFPAHPNQNTAYYSFAQSGNPFTCIKSPRLQAKNPNEITFIIIDE